MARTRFRVGSWGFVLLWSVATLLGHHEIADLFRDGLASAVPFVILNLLFTFHSSQTYDSSMSSYTDPAIRITLLPRDTNSQGTVFGGIILSYIDMAGAIEAHRRTRMERFVTVAMREVIFHKPVFVGDLASFYAETVSIGNTSITVRVIVEAERMGSSTDRVRVTEAEVIYVAVDENRQKTKIVNRES